MKGVGDVNMKGKKSYNPSCGCCSFYNEKEEILKKLHEKDIEMYTEDRFLDYEPTCWCCYGGDAADDISGYEEHYGEDF